MTIEKNQSEKTLTLKLTGKLDTTTAPELERIVKEELDGIEELTLDLEKLEYTSSAGLRVLLLAQKRMDAQGAMKVLHVNEEVMEIFDITGFTDVFTIL